MIPDKNDPILVTGGGGYLASWILKHLLDDGYRVNTTVRDPSNADKNSHLLGLSGKYPGKLDIFKAELLEAGSFEKAMEGCRLVIHTASPFKVMKVRDAYRELVKPAVTGTENILNSVKNNPAVKKVVLTSSVAAVYGDGSEIERTEEGTFSEKDWNNTSRLNYLPYSYSKALAEKKAWELAGSQNSWQLAVINPGFVIGPSLSKRIDGTSVGIILSMANGKFRTGVPDLYFGIADVRDVARAHVLAGFNSKALGRFIVTAESLSMPDIAAILVNLFGRRYPFPRSRIPKSLLYIFGPMLGYSWNYIRNNVAVPIRFDNSRSKNILGLKYRAPAETLKDHIDQLERDELLP
ncbi:MAG TPA: aldehyde reductase [Cyclobacteriaceae bacterium]|nr:aldehyde reductase [Cyclobacteriaceae bacterium]